VHRNEVGLFQIMLLKNSPDIYVGKQIITNPVGFSRKKFWLKPNTFSIYFPRPKGRGYSIILVYITIVLLSLLQSNSFAQTSDGLRNINGTQLYIKTFGKGEPLLIVHGGPGMNHSYFMPHLDALSKKFKIVLYDQRASGKSAIPSTDSISLKFFVDDIEAIRKYLGVDKLNILGHSWGVIPAVEYGIRYPLNTKSLILCNPVPLNREFDHQMAVNQKSKLTKQDSTDRATLFASPEFKSGNTQAYKKLLLLSFRHSFYSASNYKKLHYEMPENYPQASRALFTGLTPDLKTYDYYEAVKAFSFPVLIIHGQVDAIPLSAVTRMQSSISNASLEVYQKSGHFVFIDEPKKFKSSVQKFLKK